MYERECEEKVKRTPKERQTREGKKKMGRWKKGGERQDRQKGERKGTYER